MGAVFISYRRADSEGQARALSLELEKLLGRDSLFMDVDGIALGRDFRQIIHERLQHCDVMLALIGPRWLDAADAKGNRLLDNPRDFVRQELAAALKRNILVIPVLLQGTPIPSPEQLPEDIRDLSYRNGFDLEHSTWESDVREMVKRLGLDQQTATPTVSPEKASAPPRTPGTPTPMKRSGIAYAAAGTAAVVISALLLYLYSSFSGTEQTQPTQASPTDAAATTPRDATPTLRGTTGVTNTPLTPPAPAGKAAISALEFNWPGDDCWDVFRGTERVTYKCGSQQQALEAGTYTLKGRSGPIFVPFDVVIRNGAPTRVNKGGVFEFKWPGDDCWDVLRGEEFVAYQCGSKKQALGAGSYTIKGRHAPVFVPFQIDIKDGVSTTMSAGGVFTFNWPGKDCWDVMRGDDQVIYQCGTKSQALGAGTYTIKGRHAAVFRQFTIKIADGAQVEAP